MTVSIHAVHTDGADLFDDTLLSTSQRVIFPQAPRGRQTQATQATYQKRVTAFAAAIRAMDCELDFKVSSRGWCYLLEPHGLSKADFDKAQNLINECRKSGLLPLDICAEDSARAWQGVEVLDYANMDEEVQWRWDSIQTWIDGYQPISFWENQDYYVQLYVEKIDLRSLFDPICRRYHIPIANGRGWSDFHLRAAAMRRFQAHERQGRQGVLLYCGDHDPGGLLISESILSNLHDLKDAVGWNPANLIVERFGLNKDFIDQHRLTWIDNLITGSGGNLASESHPDHKKAHVQDYLKAFGARKVEANALVAAPVAGRQLCETAILKYINPGRIKEFQSSLELSRKALARLFADSVSKYATAWEAQS